ncbi:MAG TPA: methionyl-tRNA formyltransferase, partial [Thermomicrobiales bacterium]|nr:methionyl-tRNA formyltransferase [Thermomicrobiales bacterium]
AGVPGRTPRNELRGSVVRVVFFGSPDLAVPALQSLAASSAFDVVLVVTQAAKGMSPVEVEAERLGLPVYKPETLRDPVSREPLIAAAPDLFVVAAFGLIFRQRTLDIPRHGSINIHPSLLPKYRGASPIVAAIASGDRETGVALMVMDTGIDTGAVISQERAEIAHDDTSESLGDRLGRLGAEMAVRDIPRWVKGELVASPQQGSQASLTRTLTKADGWIDWTRPAVEIERQVRAMWPWPRAWTTVHGAPIQIHRGTVVEVEPGVHEPGAVISERRRLIVACGEHALEIDTIEPAGRRAMPANAYLNGIRMPITRFGQTGAPEPRPPLIVPVES